MITVTLIVASALMTYSLVSGKKINHLDPSSWHTGIVLQFIKEKFFRESESNQANMMELDSVQLRELVRKSGTSVELNDADTFGDGDQSPLYGNKAQIIRDIWSSGADFLKLASDAELGQFSLHCFTGQHAQVEAMLESSTHSERVQLLESRESMLRNTPLMTCVNGIKFLSQRDKALMKSDHRRVVRLLLDHGARVDARDFAGHTALYLASGDTSTEDTLALLDDLVAAGADVNAPNRFGAISLHAAVMAGNRAAVRALLSYGADPHRPDNDGVTPLSMVSAAGGSMYKLLSSPPQLPGRGTSARSRRGKKSASLPGPASADAGPLRTSRSPK